APADLFGHAPVGRTDHEIQRRSDDGVVVEAVSRRTARRSRTEERQERRQLDEGTTIHACPPRRRMTRASLLPVRSIASRGRGSFSSQYFVIARAVVDRAIDTARFRSWLALCSMRATVGRLLFAWCALVFLLSPASARAQFNDAHSYDDTPVG